MICRDFNAIFSLEDKSSGDPNLVDIRGATALLQELCLIEPSNVGRRLP